MDFLKEAINESKKAIKMNEVPVGAVLVLGNKIVARAHNTKESDNDPTQHAEIKILQNYCKKIKNWRLNGYSLFTTLEPCLMCAGAIIHSRISKVVYCCKNSKYSTAKIMQELSENNNINHTISWEFKEDTGFQTMFLDFFKTKRSK